MKLPIIFGTMTTISLLFTSSIASTNNVNAAPSHTARIRNSDRLAQNSQQQADRLLTAGNQKFRTRDYAGAITDFFRAIQIAPNFEKAFYNRGVSYDLSNNKQSTIDNYSQAIQLNDFSKTIELTADSATAYYNRAAARQALKDRSGAVSDFQTATKLYQQQGNKQESNNALNLIWQVQNQK